MEHIDSSQIHLWLAFLDEITDPRLLGEYRRLLSREELQQQGRFYFERDRHRYLVTRAVVRTTLSKYCDVAPWEWRFDVNAYGKPSIASGLAQGRGIEFNVSHTDGLVVMAVTRARALGVDVENLRARQVDIEIADRYFAAAEVAALRALPREQQQQRFFEYWTLKESYIKARGMGLLIPLDRFAFHLDDAAAIRCTFAPVLGDHLERWEFWQFAPQPGYLVSVCVANSDGVTGTLTAFETVPLLQEQP